MTLQDLLKIIKKVPKDDRQNINVVINDETNQEIFQIKEIVIRSKTAEIVFE